MLCSILVRRLREDAGYNDFHDAWFPDHGFGVPARVRNAVRVDDPRELLSVGIIDLPVSELAAGLERVGVEFRAPDGTTTRLEVEQHVETIDVGMGAEVPLLVSPDGTKAVFDKHDPAINVESVWEANQAADKERFRAQLEDR